VRRLVVGERLWRAHAPSISGARGDTMHVAARISTHATVCARAVWAAAWSITDRHQLHAAPNGAAPRHHRRPRPCAALHPCPPQINSLTGTIPPNLCGANTSMRVLNVRANQIGGPASPVTKCTRLASLDLGFNEFTGSLPATKVRSACAAAQASGGAPGNPAAAAGEEALNRGDHRGWHVVPHERARADRGSYACMQANANALMQAHANTLMQSTCKPAPPPRTGLGPHGVPDAGSQQVFGGDAR
jgi:hypothetical protein